MTLQIEPQRPKSPGERAAQAIINQLESKAGGRFYIHLDHPEPGCVVYTWKYDCPCGEVSGYQGIVPWLYRLDDADVGEFVRHHVDIALECMRRHVRSEGNEPSF